VQEWRTGRALWVGGERGEGGRGGWQLGVSVIVANVSPNPALDFLPPCDPIFPLVNGGQFISQVTDFLYTHTNNEWSVLGSLYDYSTQQVQLAKNSTSGHSKSLPTFSSCSFRGLECQFQNRSKENGGRNKEFAVFLTIFTPHPSIFVHLSMVFGLEGCDLSACSWGV